MRRSTAVSKHWDGDTTNSILIDYNDATITKYYIIKYTIWLSIHAFCRVFLVMQFGAVFSSPAFSSPTFLTVPRFPASRFQSPDPVLSHNNIQFVYEYYRTQNRRAQCCHLFAQFFVDRRCFVMPAFHSLFKSSFSPCSLHTLFGNSLVRLSLHNL